MASPGRPARLSQRRVVAAAEAVVSAEGIDALSMRRVAHELDCTPMALYRHVADRGELLRLLLDHIAPTLRRPTTSTDPRRTVMRVLTITHDWLVVHPWAIEVLPSHRMGWSVAWVVDDVLAAFVSAGLSPSAAARAYEVVWQHLVGELTAGHSRRATAPIRPPDGPELAAAHPTIAALREHMSTARSHDQFIHGLSALLDGLLPD